MLTKLKNLLHAERFQGWDKDHTYFEGWYYKIVNKKEDKAFAIIPGIAIDTNGEKHAFIQVLDGKLRTAEYHTFDFDLFVASKEEFAVSIGENYFSQSKLILKLSDFKGELNFSNQLPWSNSWYSPNIMGPFSFVPFMQCYHGIVSMDHDIRGELVVDDNAIDFDGGKGYIEKDWGRSFPSAYIWLQSNHFSRPGISIKASVAKIPWLTSSFVGFIAGVLIDGELIEFTTYNLTKLRKSFADLHNVHIQMENSRYDLDIQVEREEATELAAPILGFMHGKIEESMTAHIAVKLLDKKTNTLILDDVGRNGGLEVAGKIEEILI